jgi:hypothetical protein
MSSTGPVPAARVKSPRGAAQRGDIHRDAQPGGVAAGQVEQRVGIGHAQRARAGPGPDDPVAGPNAPFAQDAQVETGTVVRHQQRGQLGLAHPQADAVAGDPGLGDLEFGLADAVPVADADLVVR